MAESYFYCEQCGRQHKWAEKFAGKKAPCKCGAKLTVPAKPTPDEHRPVIVDKADRAYVYCDKCGRQYKWQVEAAGRTFRCGCGNTLRAPMTKPGTKAAAVNDPTSSDFDLFGDEAEGLPTQPPARQASAAPKPGQTPGSGAASATPGSGSAAATPGSGGAASGSGGEEIDLLSATDQGPEDIGDRSTLVKEPVRGGPMDDDDSDFDLGGGMTDKPGGGDDDDDDDEEESEIDFFNLDEPAAPPPTVACPGCGKQYVWKPKVAGLAATCRCGTKVIMPMTKPGTKPDESAELQYEEDEKENLMSRTSAKGGFICDECGNMIPAGKTVCVKCGYDTETGEMTK